METVLPNSPTTPNDDTVFSVLDIVDLKNDEFSTRWRIFYVVTLLLSIILLIICFTIPLTGAFLVYTIILSFISIHEIVRMTLHSKGKYCLAQNQRINKIDDILTILTTVVWIIAFMVCIICGLSDMVSAFVFYNRWEEVLPIFIAILIEIVLIKRILVCRARLLPPNNRNMFENFNKYHSDIVTSANATFDVYKNKMYFVPYIFKWLFLTFIIALAFSMSIHSAQKSAFINTFNDRNTKILTTENYGTFEYQCLGIPNNASIRIITIGGMSTVHLSFGFYNNLIWNEYSVKHKKEVVICDYNRGGFGFTETKEYNNKLVGPEVNHLFEIADTLFGDNASFHLMGHSRAGLILLQAKLLNAARIESMVVFDGVSNANIIKNGMYDRTFGNWGLWYIGYSIGLPMITNAIAKPLIVGMAGGDMYEPELSTQYYSFRNYMYQSIVWEVKDMEQAWINTVELYGDIEMKNNDQNFTFDPVLNVECDVDYNRTIWYSTVNNTLYVQAGHAPCVYDSSIANMTFYYNDSGLKQFYDALFL